MSPRRHWLPMLSALALLFSSFALAPQPMRAQGEAVTYTVNTTSDALAGDCTATPTTCSLRQAINSASTDGTTSLIQFSLAPGTQVITLTSELPSLAGSGDRISGAVDNFGRPRVVISGNNNDSIRYGIRITGSNNTIEKLIFNNFDSNSTPNGVGIWITGAGATGNRILGNYFGIRPGEITSYPNSRGIQIDNGASGNIIGGSASEPTQRNIIAGNDLSGILLSGANGNFIRGNYIGMALDTGGNVVALGNGGPGVELSDSANNEVGGTADQRNLIADNSVGILISGAGATGNRILSNYIGTEDNGLAVLGSQEHGVVIQSGAKNNQLSGSSSAQLVISGNTGYGVLLRGDGTTGNTISGAYIGTGFNSTTAVPNGTGGVRIEDHANLNTIGPNAVISGNTGDGVSIGLTLPTSTAVISNSIKGSYIGLNRDGTAVVPNTGRGIVVNNGASETVIGGSSEADGNFIAGNGGVAILISGAPARPNVSNRLTTVRNNWIGLRRATAGGFPTERAPNGGEGVVVIDGARQVTITGNTITGDADNTATDFPGIRVEGDNTVGSDGPLSLSPTNVATVTISLNRIGWRPTSSTNNAPVAVPNGDGVVVSGRVQAVDVLSNTIQFNHGVAIRLTDVLTATVRGHNPIFRNRGIGVRVGGQSRNLTIERNIIRENGRNAAGTGVAAANSHGVALIGPIQDTKVISNSLVGNTGRGIFLQGNVDRATLQYNYLTQNGGPIELAGTSIFTGTSDPDTQSLPNHGIDPPIVDTTFVNPLSLRVNQAGFIEGYVYTSTVQTEAGLDPVSACVDCKIQLFGVSPTLAQPDGQGAILLRTVSEAGGSTPRDFITVDSNGRFSARIVDPLPRQILLVATDRFGNSSEYALMPVTGGLVLEGVGPLAADAAPGDTITYTLRLTNTGTVGYTNLRLSTSGTLERWIVGTEPISNTEFALAAGQSRLITVTLTLPTGPDPNVASGKVDTTTVRITGSPPAVTATAQLVTTVLPRPVIRVLPTRHSLGSGKPDTIVPHAFTLRNDGNVTVTLNLDYTTVDAAASPGIWATTLSTDTLTIAPGEEARTLLSVTIPTGALQGASATTYITGTIQPGVPPGPVFPSQTELFSATTRADLNDNADLYPNQTAEGAAGGEVSLTHTVENKSNGVATFCLDYVAASQSTVRFVSATNNFSVDDQGCFTLYTTNNSSQGQFTQAQFRAIVTLDQRLLRGDIEHVTIFLRKGSPDGETISDAVVEDTITINAGFKLPRLWVPLASR